jgi:hypothetical protein
LFFEARAAQEAGRYDEAAELFRRSNALFPAPTAALGLARALRDGKQLVAAYETYTSIVREGVPADASEPFVAAVATAREEKAALEPRLPAVILEVEPDGALVRIDGIDVPAAALGVKRFVDPGERVVEASAAGHVAQRRTIRIAEGQVETVRIALEPVAVSPPEPSDQGSGMRTAGIVIGSVGLASLVAAAVTGAMYLDRKAIVDERCVSVEGGRQCPHPEGVTAAEEGRTLGLVNSITLPAGVAAVGVGAILFFVAPREDVTVTPMAGPEAGGLVVRGTF